MWRWIVLCCISLWITVPAFAAFNLTLPIIYSDKEIGEVPVEVDGMTLTGIGKEDLKAILGARVSPEWWHNIEKKNTSLNAYIEPKLLAENGLGIELDPENLVILVIVSSELLAEQDINLSNGYPLFIPTESGNFAWLNSINTRYDMNWDKSTESWSTSVDWLSQLNIGGAKGVNALLANYIYSDQEETRFQRGEWKAFYDEPNMPLRISVGDISSGESGHITNIALGGISIESRYADLQPNRDISPESSQQLVLLESAEVDVYVNGERISGGRLEPGRYNLQNLMLGNGANDITVEVSYLSGRQETLKFTQFYNSKLLEEGLFDYAFSSGKPLNYNDDGIDYSDVVVSTGFIEYGVLNWLTLGVNGLHTTDGQVIGGIATLSSDFGNLTGRFSVSDGELHDKGKITSLDYEHSVIGRGDSQSPNLRLAIEHSKQFVSQPWLESEYENEYLRYLGNYFWQITSEFDLTLSGRLTTYPIADKEITATTLLNWRKRNLAVGVGMEYEESERYTEPDSRILFTLDWSWYSKYDDHRMGVSYNSESQRSRIYLNNEGLERVGDAGYRIEAEKDDYQVNQKAVASYTANRFRVESEISRYEMQATGYESYQASIRASTAIGIVDNQIGWGRVPSGPFVIASLHPTLPNSRADLDVAQDGVATAQATSLINGMFSLSQPYATNHVDYNVIDAPIGYDWGEGQISFTPGIATGHFMQIGSDASYTAKGVLLFNDESPLDYYQGTIKNDHKSVRFFTNKQGRFFVQGLTPGKYTLTPDGMDMPDVLIQIIKKETSLVDLGVIYVTCEGGCNNDK
ncbi:fimbria/pilus outer membrane usher protein [Aliivibrio fischeri]|uniref:fimbria/pilus outer membrane usher protein n=1 Tax=Aliivibrio fischeri TaxID=668 RepID=UPI0012DA3D9F|nr:fimbria/pilus outer membrane usher protein [Aliivibrio fischeri]MUJ27588.1 fimbria/pilus outer membrane usher protein [Aliivibrio fischeri]